VILYLQTQVCPTNSEGVYCPVQLLVHPGSFFHIAIRANPFDDTCSPAVQPTALLRLDDPMLMLTARFIEFFDLLSFYV
jgi:hypothetical protein